MPDPVDYGELLSELDQRRALDSGRYPHGTLAILDSSATAIRALIAERDKAHENLAQERRWRLRDLEQARRVEAEREALREALKPFADVAVEYDASDTSDAELDECAVHFTIAVGDLRRARQALKEPSHG